MRQLQRGHLQQQPQRRLQFGAAAADQLDIVEQESHNDHRRKHRTKPAEELAGDIGGEGLGELQRYPLAGPGEVQRAGSARIDGRRKPSLIPPRSKIPNPRTSGKRSAMYISGIAAAYRPTMSLTARSSNSNRKARPIASRTRFSWPRRLSSPGKRQASGIREKLNADNGTRMRWCPSIRKPWRKKASVSGGGKNSSPKKRSCGSRKRMTGASRTASSSSV